MLPAAKMPCTIRARDGQLACLPATTYNTTPVKKQPRCKSTPMKKTCKKIKVTRQLSRAELATVADVDDTQLLCDICTTVSRDLVGEIFLERTQL